MAPQRPSPSVSQYLEISAGLRRLYDSERKFLSGNRQFHGIVASHLQKHSRVRAALVRLSRRVQESRTEAQTGCHTLLVAHQMPQSLQALFVLGIHLDVAEHREVDRKSVV